MFSKTILLSAVFALLSSTANGHAMVTPAMGVSGKASRGNVQRPSTAKPCGNVNIAIDSAQTVAANAQGVFTVTAQNFNGGKDGSRQFTMQVDAAGTGKNFVAGQVTKNGDLAPKDVGTQQLTASLPAGTKCTGGQSKNRCLVSFKNASGFGNCVVVSQGAQGAQKRDEVADTAATDASATPTSATATDASAQKVDAAAAAASSAAPAAAAASSSAAAAAADGKAATGGSGAAQAAAAAKKNKKAGKKGKGKKGKKGKKAGKKANANKDAAAADAKNAQGAAAADAKNAQNAAAPSAAAASQAAAAASPAADVAAAAESAAVAPAVVNPAAVGTRAARAARRAEQARHVEKREEPVEEVADEEEDSEDHVVAKRSLFGRIWI
jgi:hypothetical protein